MTRQSGPSSPLTAVAAGLSVLMVAACAALATVSPTPTLELGTPTLEPTEMPLAREPARATVR